VKRALAGALAGFCLLAAACTSDDSQPSTAPSTSAAIPQRPVRIGVWMPPDVTANTYGGAAVRALVYPQLFRATPQGRWEADLVEPGSDATRPGARSARFRLRRNARWSDGTPITVSDLRRTLDGRFVSGIDDPTPSGTIVVHFSTRLPGWRRLWSGLETISPPSDGVFGGPYRVSTTTPGLETVLIANRRYHGDSPNIREVRLVLVPDPEIQARLMENGDLDVIAPPAFTDRTARLRDIPKADVLVGDATRGGWSASLVANPARLAVAQRVAVLTLVDTKRFTEVLLHGEATPGGSSVAKQATPAKGARPAVTGPLESGPANALLRAIARNGRKAGVDIDLRQGEFDRVLATYAGSAFDVLLHLEPGTPEPCWTCRYAPVDAPLAAAADGGDAKATAALKRKLLADALVLPLWRERPVAAVRDGLENVSVNGFHVAGPAWNIANWRWGH
jgi:hypothetical protein